MRPINRGGSPLRRAAPFFAFLFLVAAAAIESMALTVRVAEAKTRRTTYTCHEGNYAFNGYITDGGGHTIGCNLLWQPDWATSPGPSSSCAPNGVVHWTAATLGFLARNSLRPGFVISTFSAVVPLPMARHSSMEKPLSSASLVSM